MCGAASRRKLGVVDRVENPRGSKARVVVRAQRKQARPAEFVGA